jgi:diguanylate cyclase (GGDEF)-like protein
MADSRAVRFALLGLALAAGAPAGLLALRCALGRASLAALAEEWRRDALTYSYVTVSTALVFTCFGAALGRAADRLSRLASRDGLTGLLNRAGMRERIADEMRRQRRFPAPLSLLLMDVDRMKEINDTHGHAAGDEALRRVARAVDGSRRGMDAAGRWGGDEFLVLAPATDFGDAVVLASRIRRAIAERKGAPPVSVSIGVATLPASVESPPIEELLQAADDALYEAKHAGGDQVAARPPAP